MVRAEPVTYADMPPAGPLRTSRCRASREIQITILIAIAHLPLGLVLYNAGSLAILHPIAVFCVGFHGALKKRIRLDWVALAIGYLIGAEVLWRMAQIPIYWEFGKYGSAVIMIVALVRRRRLVVPKLPLAYFLALIPACLITLAELDLKEAETSLSFNMSGPLFLLISCWFFSHVKVNVTQLRRMLFAVMIPLLSIAVATLFYTITSESIEFNTESNFATSGGFGPNQVSSMLGLGLFLTMGCIVIFKNSIKFKATLGALAILFAAQSMLTFSRGGIYNAAGGLLVMTLFHFRKFADGVKRLLPIVLFLALFIWIVFPFLNSFTGGKLQERFEEEDTTKRVDIIQSDFKIFQENLMFGVGVGFAEGYRKRFLGYSALSHTEFSRLISEHGSLGIVALLCLLSMTVTNLIRQRSTLGRALIAGVSVWSVLFMLNAGMRLAAPSFVWGVAFVTVVGSRRPRRSDRVRETITHLGPPKRALARGNLGGPAKEL